MKRGGGYVTAADLAAYRAKLREPVRGSYRGYEVLGPPPPSSGGTVVIEMLNILDNFDLKKEGRWSPRTLHLTVEAMRRAYLDRARYLGDPDFAGPPPAKLLDREYGRKLAAAIDLNRATPSADLAPDIGLAPEGTETTHFGVVDADGNAVSNTYTLEAAFGSKVVVPGAGFILNNEMGDFNPKPGHTDRKGKIGTEPNRVAPGKRMLSSMTPLVVRKDGRPVLVTGSPGGRTIPNTVLEVTLNVLEFDMPLREAVDAPRMHHAWMPDVLRVEPAALKDHATAFDALRAMGHAVQPPTERGRQGDAHSIRVTPDGYEGVADRRHAGWAAGY
jgi:gamma-glutamyltranspeptidase / glutathione hydrolase